MSEDVARSQRPQAATILVVDDTRENLTVIGDLLQPFYRVRVANSGERALKVAGSDPRPDLVLLDIMMPVMDGYAVISELKRNPDTRDIPVIFVTAMDAEDDEERGLSLGAVDYVTKPIKPAILLARVRAHLELKQARDWLRDQNGYLDAQVRRRTIENELIKDVSLNALALLAEKRDNETGLHLQRTQLYVDVLTRHLAQHPRFRDALTEPQRTLIVKGTPLHDIGKVGIPDAILLKPGKLTPEEFVIMKTHSTIGAEAITDAIHRVTEAMQAEGADAQGALNFLDTARQIALGHHEKWDGSGYPRGLKGDDIPVAARIMAIADVFDALISKRHYKDPMPIDKVFEIISSGRGAHFDPDVADAFLSEKDVMLEIADKYKDQGVHA